MKKIIFALFVATGTFASAQVLSNGVVANQFPNENIFLDASTNNNSTVNDGKGLLFPSTDLTQFTFKTASLDGINFPSAYDGMVVYNTATGNTVTGNGVVTAVTPGFYYFSNPGQSTDVTPGRWLPMGGGGSPKFDVTTTADGTATNTLVSGSQVYAIKGQFTTTGSTTAVTITPPTGITSMYGITIYKKAGVGTGNGNKVVYSRDLYSYDLATGAAVTGSQSMSVVYPADTYEYILEYLK